MAELPDSVDSWLSERDRTPLNEGELMRYEYVSAGRSSGLNIVATVDSDGNVVGADDLSWTRRRSIRSFAADVADLDPYVPPEADTRGGQYEIVTVRRGDDIHQVVFDNVDNKALEILRDAVDQLR